MASPSDERARDHVGNWRQARIRMPRRSTELRLAVGDRQGRRVTETVTRRISDRREAGQLVRGRPCGKWPPEHRMHNLIPQRVGWRREIRIGEAAYRDPLGVGVPVAFPNDVAACAFGQPVP